MAIKKSGTVVKGNEPTYEVVEECGVISVSGEWETKLRLVSWNGREPKYDIRPWKDTPEGERCGKGITLTGEELETLHAIIGGMMEE